MRRRPLHIGLLGVVTALALVAAACGADDAASPDASPTTAAPTSSAPATSSPEQTTPTTIPLVTVPAGEQSGAAGGNRGDQAGQPDQSPPDPGSPSGGPATTAPGEGAGPGQPAEPPQAPAPALPPTGNPDLDDILGDQPVVEPPEGAGTAIRATISPVDGLAVGDVVQIEAENIPPNQFMAWAQCDEQAAEVTELMQLIVLCAVGGLGSSTPEGTASVSLTIVPSVGGVDCVIETCVVGLIVFPGTDDLRAYQPITLTG